jgi:uncharacterized protein YdiU (UPF0061 family)
MIQIQAKNFYDLKFDNRFAKLPADFYTKMSSEGFADKPFIIHANAKTASLISLKKDAFQDPDFPFYFSGIKNLPGSDPLAMVYSGHQFGFWAGQLGDGRALLLGQTHGTDGQLWDIQLKGSGLTPYSRMGDGRAVLRSTIREYLCGEAMHGLGIPTSRALCIIGTNELVQREKKEPGAILTRLSPCHIRFGHFEHFYHAGKTDLLMKLAEHVSSQYFNDLPHEEWFTKTVIRTAGLIAKWQSYGFAHGVMNTDNMSITGLTIDYGPFGFMEEFNPDFICNHSDSYGRYAFNLQPAVGLWNLQALAVTMQPFFSLKKAKDIIQLYSTSFSEEYHLLMTSRLGLENPQPEDSGLYQELLQLMQKNRSDYTLSFRALALAVTNENPFLFLQLLKYDEKAKVWLDKYQERIGARTIETKQRILKTNPEYVLRNWVAQIAINAAEKEQNYQPITDILKILENPFLENAEFVHLSGPPPAEMRNLSVSCSS